MANRGHERERRVVSVLRDEDWLAFRAPGSLGVADVVALREGSRPKLIEVKSTISPYSHFLPADRKRLSLAAGLAGADAWLAWWPSRGRLHWIAEHEWPEPKETNADAPN